MRFTGNEAAGVLVFSVSGDSVGAPVDFGCEGV